MTVAQLVASASFRWHLAHCTVPLSVFSSFLSSACTPALKAATAARATSSIQTERSMAVLLGCPESRRFDRVGGRFRQRYYTPPARRQQPAARATFFSLPCTGRRH